MKPVKTLLIPSICAISFGCAFALSVRAADLHVSTNDIHSVEGSDLGWGTYTTDDGENHDAYTNLLQAVNAAESGLGARTVVATSGQLFRNAARRDWRLRPGSPARDVVEPADAGAMPARDLLCNPRLSNGLYDLGCFEAVFRGFGIFVR